jgi:hypothetical protein
MYTVTKNLTIKERLLQPLSQKNFFRVQSPIQRFFRKYKIKPDRIAANADKADTDPLSGEERRRHELTLKSLKTGQDERVEACVLALHALEYPHTRVIGSVLPEGEALMSTPAYFVRILPV